MENTLSYTSSNRYASFMARLKAWFIDLVILFTLWFTIGIIYNLLTEGFDFSALRFQIIAKSWPVVIINILIGLAYFVLFDSSAKQGTIGKQAVDIKVTDMDGQRISIVKALIRGFIKIILSIGYIFPIFTKNKQALHDMIGGTLVMKNY